MPTIKELEQQKAEIEKQIEQATKQQKQEDLKTVRQLCKRHGFTHNMLKNHLAAGKQRRTG